MIDTHSHLYLPEFGEDGGAAAVDRAVAAGVELTVLPGIDSASIAPIRRLHAARPQSTAMCIGLHPTEVKAETYLSELQIIGDELSARREDYVGLGEIGLDLYWEQSTLPAQLQAARSQLDLAYDLGLPAVIHCREAMPQMLDLLKSQSPRLPRLAFHCYSGTARDTQDLLRLQPEIMFGIGGVLTFKKSQLPETVKTIPLQNILLETDAPWLAPAPMRGKQNESAYLGYIASFLASILGLTTNHIDQQTTQNAKEFFKLR